MEVLNVHDSAAVQKHIRSGEFHKIRSELETGEKHKSIKMDKHIEQLWSTGQISPEEAVAYAFNKDEMASQVLGKR